MADVRPHTVLGRDDVRLAALSVAVDPSRPDAGPVLTEWTVRSPVHVSVVLESELDSDKVLNGLGLQEGRVLRAMTWQATGTRNSGLVGIESGHVGDLSGVISPPIDGRLRLTISLMVESCEAVEPLAPSLDGLVVWEASETLFLSGEASRFPVSTLDFATAGLPAGALWRLDVDVSDLSADTSGCLALYLNVEHPRYPDLLEAASSDLLAVLEWDIRRHVVDRVVDEEIEVPSSPDEGSMGAFVRQCCQIAAETADVQGLRRIREVDRARYETLIRGNSLVLPNR